jgi:hypothetical protein
MRASHLRLPMDSWDYFGAAMFLDHELRGRPDQPIYAGRPDGGRTAKPCHPKRHAWSLNPIHTFATRIALGTVLVAARAVNILR